MQKRFDQFADKVEEVVANAIFFAFCLLLVILWVPSYFLFENIDTWQLIINTATTIITFLLVALLQNTQRRFEERVDARLAELIKAISDAKDPVDEAP